MPLTVKSRKLLLDIMTNNYENEYRDSKCEELFKKKIPILNGSATVTNIKSIIMISSRPQVLIKDLEIRSQCTIYIYLFGKTH